jgi:Spy/CpxP family protein refolding chaperone
MSKYLGSALIAMGLLSAMTGNAAAQYGGPGMMGSGMTGSGMTGSGMMGPGMMGPGMMSSYWGVDLTPEQRSKIAQIQNESRKRHWNLMAQMHEEQYKLQELYYSGTSDSAAIGAQQQKVANLQGQMMQSMIEAQNQTEKLLTADQKEKVRSKGRGWMTPCY